MTFGVSFQSMPPPADQPSNVCLDSALNEDVVLNGTVPKT